MREFFEAELVEEFEVRKTVDSAATEAKSLKFDALDMVGKLGEGNFGFVALVRNERTGKTWVISAPEFRCARTSATRGARVRAQGPIPPPALPH